MDSSLLILIGNSVEYLFKLDTLFLFLFSSFNFRESRILHPITSSLQGLELIHRRGNRLYLRGSPQANHVGHSVRATMLVTWWLDQPLTPGYSYSREAGHNPLKIIQYKIYSKKSMDTIILIHLVYLKMIWPITLDKIHWNEKEFPPSGSLAWLRCWGNAPSTKPNLARLATAP